MVIQDRITDRSSISINKYLNEVSKIPLLNIDDEIKYAKLAVEGDEQAKVILIRSNLRFVITVAKQYQSNNFKLNDLINEGNLGLIEAVNRYDPSRGFKLISYAVWYIRAKILDFVQTNQNMCEISKSKVGKIPKLKKVISRLENQLCRDIYIDDLYGNVEGMSDYEIDEVYNIIKYYDVSTSQQLGDEDGMTVGDTLPSSSYKDILQAEEHEFQLNKLNELIDALPLRHRTVMNQIYGLNGHEAIGERGYAEKYGIGVPRVAQLRDVAIRQLKRYAVSGVPKKEVPKTQAEIRSEITDKYTKPKIIINGKPFNEDRDDIDEMIRNTDYVIREPKVEEKKSSGIAGLFKSIFK
jgi:RNA polymerase primary sigma factor